MLAGTINLCGLSWTCSRIDVAAALGLYNEEHALTAALILGHISPIGIVGPDRRVDDEPS